MKKLKTITLQIDRVTGEPRCIKELNALCKRKPKIEDCKKDNKSPQSNIDIKNINFNSFRKQFNLYLRFKLKALVIGALKKILKKSTEAETITEVEEYVIDSVFHYYYFKCI